MESCLIDCNAKLSSLKELEEVSLWYVTYYTPNLDAKGKCDYLNFNPIISESAAGRSVIPSYKEVLAAKDFLGIDPWCDISYMDKLDNARIEPFTATRCGELNGQGIGELVTFVPKFKYFYWWSSDGKMGQWVEGGALNEAWIDFYAKHLCGE